MKTPLTTRRHRHVWIVTCFLWWADGVAGFPSFPKCTLWLYAYNFPKTFSVKSVFYSGNTTQVNFTENTSQIYFSVQKAWNTQWARIQLRMFSFVDEKMWQVSCCANGSYIASHVLDRIYQMMPMLLADCQMFCPWPWTVFDKVASYAWFGKP